jgi:hypothetical protein
MSRWGCAQHESGSASFGIKAEIVYRDQFLAVEHDLKAFCAHPLCYPSHRFLHRKPI